MKRKIQKKKLNKINYLRQIWWLFLAHNLKKKKKENIFGIVFL